MVKGSIRFETKQGENSNFFGSIRGRGGIHSLVFHDQGQTYEKSHIQCHYCQKIGHFAPECRKKQFDMNRQNANFSRENHSENSDSMFITCNSAQESSKEVWFLDSGCSNHMSGNKDMFANIDESVQSEIKLGDDKKVVVMGKGSIKFETKQGEKKHIPNVYYVPNLKHNLISIGKLL